MAKSIKKVCIVYRPNSDTVLQTVHELVGWLVNKGITTYIPSELATIPQTKKITTAKQFSGIGLVIALGGDGTFLRAINLIEARPIPILGINLGNLGFLTEIKAEELYNAVDLALQQKMVRIERTMLQATVIPQKGDKKTYSIFNDIVVERTSNINIVNLSIFIGHHFVSNLKADGVIVSSPTGSTAYSLAAGGPILSPEVKAFLITPVCPHTLTNRPIVFPDDQEVKLKLIGDVERATLMLDGQKVDELKNTDILLITKSKKPVIMLSPTKRNYFDVLRTKLRFGERD